MLSFIERQLHAHFWEKIEMSSSRESVLCLKTVLQYVVVAKGSPSFTNHLYLFSCLAVEFSS